MDAATIDRVGSAVHRGARKRMAKMHPRLKARQPDSFGLLERVLRDTEAPARRTRSTSALESAAATSSSRREPSGRPRRLPRKLWRILSCTGSSWSRPKPPAALDTDTARVISTRPSGFPSDSAARRLSTRRSIMPGISDRSSSSLCSVARAWRTRSRRNVDPASLVRVANSSATGSASRLRATNLRTWADSVSSQCASSTAQTSGHACAASDNRLRTPIPTCR
jgi:hypothetical protein